MGLKLTKLVEGEHVSLHVSNKTSNLTLKASVTKPLNENTILVNIEDYDDRRLIFDNVQVDLEYYHENDAPTIWYNVKIASYRNAYIVQTPSEGTRNNRRNSFRVPVATTSQLRVAGRGTQYVMVKDISLSGFAISDRKRELNLEYGEDVFLFFDDLGYVLELQGRVTRIEVRDDMIIYGFAICNLCNDLSAYVNAKQRSIKRPLR
ncbi:MAG: PilZ domain-containing protein [Lachnospiraceae bacterium]|nr:PilZ domain-containing protein [Lachnospiraceae bacterium]